MLPVVYVVSGGVRYGAEAEKKEFGSLCTCLKADCSNEFADFQLSFNKLSEYPLVKVRGTWGAQPPAPILSPPAIV